MSRSVPKVIVLGGGPAGAVAAMVLARGGVEVAVFEASAGPEPKIGENLPPALRPLLERLGLSSLLEAAGHVRCHGHRSVWGGDEPVEEDFLFGTFGSGWHLDRARFEGMLAEAAVEAGARWGWDHHAVDARWSAGRWTLEVEAPSALIEVQADFVIDATGRPARFARGAGARRRQLDKLVGVAVTLESPAGASALALDGFTLVEARPDGWWYTAPLAGERAVAMFMTDGDRLSASGLRSAEGWSAALRETTQTRGRLDGAFDLVSVEPRVMPAGSAWLEHATGPGWLAVGDAAMAFDPLSSHGMGSGMTTGYYGACAVAEHLAGNPDALETYEVLVHGMFDDYLERLHQHYRLEQRWPSAPFWSRRHHPMARATA
ncbi:MAG: tryptophan 7-halogenase [Myxococcota bacterium]